MKGLSAEKRDGFTDRGANLPEIIVLLVYGVLNIVLTVFHEPWFDEAESWLIARDASYLNMIFVRPHYEGHPPLWHIILSVPAKLGLPYEPSIKTIQFAFAMLMIGLILFRSPFPRYIRCFLPFTFFFFYQYGVIARPYAMFCTAMFLLAVFWKDRNEKPWRAVLMLLWLCLSSAYGILLSAGIASVWTIEMLLYERKDFFGNKRRLAALSFLFFMALFLVVIVFPVKDTQAMVYVHSGDHGFLWEFLFFLFVIPSELVITSCSDYACIFDQSLDTPSFIATAFVSLVLWIVLIVICRKRKELPLLIVPYLIMGFVVAGSYFNVHHYGLLLAFFIFICWTAYEAEPFGIKQIMNGIDRLNEKISPFTRTLMKGSIILFLCCMIVINVIWTLGSFKNEVKYKNESSRDVASFIKDNGFEKYRWFAEWGIIRDKKDPDKIILENWDATNMMVVPYNPYFDENLIYNYSRDIGYAPHRVADSEETMKKIKEWSSMPVPDFILSSTEDYPVVIDRLGLEDSYIEVTISEARRIWKADPYPDYPFYFFVRSDIYPDVQPFDQRRSRGKDGSK